MATHKKRIIMSVTDDLVTDQRVNKIATSLFNNGYDVLVVGRMLPYSVAIKRPYRVKRMRLLFKKTAMFYAEYNFRLFLLLLFSKADILLADDTDTILANYYASVLRHCPLVFDAHEMFPEVPELVGRDRVKRFWSRIEDKVFPKLKYCYTVCNSIADIYNDRYGINMRVVRNFPEASYCKVKNPDEKNSRKILLYQGAVNIGRGIEWIIDALPFIDNAVFYIAGDGDVTQQMKDYAAEKNLSDRVVFLGRIPLEDLNAITVKADMGMSLLANRGLNYYYSLPNRITDFVHAEIPVLATDFPEIHLVVKKYGIGELVSDHTPEVLAATIENALKKWDAFSPDERHKIFAKAKEELCWENEEKTLLSIFSEIM